MRKVYLFEFQYKNKIFWNAGSKAKKDISFFLKRRAEESVQTISFPARPYHFFSITDNLVYIYCELVTFFKTLFISGKVLIIQYPTDFHAIQDLMCRLTKHNRVIIILHDIEFMRYDVLKGRQDLEKSRAKFLNDIKDAYAVIASPQQIALLQKLGISNPIFSEMRLWPYHASRKNFLLKRKFSKMIVFSGNLNKSSFLMDWIQLSRTYTIELIGESDISFHKYSNVVYKGGFHPDDVIYNIDSSFGLVWDGDSIEDLNGVMGDYQKSNIPHKLSQYIAVGLPVFVSKKAGIADYVEANHIGFSIKNLLEIESILNSISMDEYMSLLSNVSKIRSDVISGKCFYEPFDNVIKNYWR